MSLGSESAFFFGASGAGGGGGAGYQINQSLRFNIANSAYLERTPSVEGNRRTWTWSGWLKRCGNNNNENVFGAGGASTNPRTNITVFFYQDDDANYPGQLVIGEGIGAYLRTIRTFRDPSSWGHLVIITDTTLSTASDRIKLYWNGVRITDFGQDTLSTNVPQNSDLGWNTTERHAIGARSYNNSIANYSNLYQAEVNFIDGQALDPTSFGEFDDNGVWRPLEYIGTYGTNGFYLPFEPPNVGDDLSGNGNDWTPNNIGNTISGAGTASLTPGSTIGSGTFKNLFNGDIGVGFYTLGNGTTNVLWTWTPDSPITFSTSVEVYVAGDAGAGASINGGALVSTPNASWTQVASGPGTINSMNFGRFSGGFDNVTSGIRVDGTVLVLPSFSDSVVDSPTDGNQTDTGVGGEVVGNYATLNPLKLGSSLSLTNGNLVVFGAGAIQSQVFSTIAVNSGLWYFEVNMTQSGANATAGVATSLASKDTYTGADANSWGFTPSSGGYYTYINGSQTFVTYTGLTNNGTFSFALDATNGNLWVTDQNGTWLTGDPSTGVSPLFSGITTTYGLLAALGQYSVGSQTTKQIANFGQQPFTHPAPAGFEALCTTNLDEPVIPDGQKFMDAVLYTGNGTSQTISGLEFSPDLVWIKCRNAAQSHQLVDTVRGATKGLFSNLTTVETTYNNVTAFNADGFDLGNHSSSNGNNDTYVAWCWDAGNTTVTNNDGTIESQVRAKPEAGFSIVSYTGSSSGTTVGHGLNAAPQMIIVKDRDFGYNWQIAHIGIGADESLLFTTAAAADYNAWNNARPTSSVFSLGPGVLGVNTDGNDLIAYCWAPVEGYSAFGSYIGNGSADGPFVFTGFKPRWVMVKSTGGTGWTIIDSARDSFNLSKKQLFPHSNNAEVDSSPDFLNVDFLSNGFKLRSNASGSNTSSQTYIYAAFADSAFSLNNRAR